MSASTRLRLRVSPGAAAAAVIGRHGDGWRVGIEPDGIERRLAMAGGQEQETA